MPSIRQPTIQIQNNEGKNRLNLVLAYFWISTPTEISFFLRHTTWNSTKYLCYGLQDIFIHLGTHTHIFYISDCERSTLSYYIILIPNLF